MALEPDILPNLVRLRERTQNLVRTGLRGGFISEKMKSKEEMQVQVTVEKVEVDEEDVEKVEVEKKNVEKVEVEKENVEKENVEKENVKKVEVQVEGETSDEVAAWRSRILMAQHSRKIFCHGYQGELPQNFTTNSFKVYHLLITTDLPL